MDAQVDLHIPELTVQETFSFAARVQGTGLKAGVSLFRLPVRVLAMKIFTPANSIVTHRTWCTLMMAPRPFCSDSMKDT